MNADQAQLQDWNLRLMDIVNEIRASAGASALEAEADAIEDAAATMNDLAGE